MDNMTFQVNQTRFDSAFLLIRLYNKRIDLALHRCDHDEDNQGPCQWIVLQWMNPKSGTLIKTMLAQGEEFNSWLSSTPYTGPVGVIVKLYVKQVAKGEQC